MPVVPADQPQRHERGGGFMAGLATRSVGARELMIWRTRTAPGGGPPPHRHDHEEISVVLEGTGTVREDGGEPLPFGPGDTLILPAGTLHEVTADAGVVLEWISALAIGTTTSRPDGGVLDTPWAE